MRKKKARNFPLHTFNIYTPSQDLMFYRIRQPVLSEYTAVMRHKHKILTARGTLQISKTRRV